MTREYIIYCDESEESGRHYSNFYGGALVRSDHIDIVRRALAEKKEELNFFGEVKWNKITENYQDKYISLCDTFFDFIEEDYIKIRVMFTDNRFTARNLSQDHHDQKYFLLYYQFIKHAFGLVYSPPQEGGALVRLYPDKMPDTDEQITRFKAFISALSNNHSFRRAGIRIPTEQVAEIRSHEHDVLQCLDIVIGAMHFRLNDKHLEKPKGSHRRGKRTRAKEKVYKHINARIRRIYPNFNIGITTGYQGERGNWWNHPYRHWVFRPNDAVYQGGSKHKK